MRWKLRLHHPPFFVQNMDKVELESKGKAKSLKELHQDESYRF